MLRSSSEAPGTGNSDLDGWGLEDALHAALSTIETRQVRLSVRLTQGHINASRRYVSLREDIGGSAKDRCRQMATSLGMGDDDLDRLDRIARRTSSFAVGWDLATPRLKIYMTVDTPIPPSASVGTKRPFIRSAKLTPNGRTSWEDYMPAPYEAAADMVDDLELPNALRRDTQRLLDGPLKRPSIASNPEALLQVNDPASSRYSIDVMLACAPMTVSQLLDGLAGTLTVLEIGAVDILDSVAGLPAHPVRRIAVGRAAGTPFLTLFA